jgi:EmrB/QacA subfamily drug resistance transporter
MTSLAHPPCDAGVICGSSPDTSGCAAAAKPWVLAATILGSSLAFIDGSVVNVALPTIQSDLRMSVRGVQWIANGYMLTLSALILVGGAAGDRFGRRRVFVLGTAGFAVASALCGLAPSATALIAARAAQGIAAALLVPSSLAMISAAFPEGERGRAIGTWAGFSALTGALGPVLGGWLVDHWSWRVIFFLNLPLAAVTVLLTYWRLPESRNEDQEGVDWLGGALATAGLGALAVGLTEMSEVGWRDATVLASLAGGVVVLAVFLWQERRAPWPMMPLALFRSPAFSGANAMTLLLYAALSAALFFVPFDLIRVQGYSTTAAGAAFLPLTLVMAALSRWSGGLIDRYGARAPLVVGPLIAGLGFALLALPDIGGSYWTTFFPPMAVLGVGMAVAVAPLTTTVMGAVDGRHGGVASGINNATARVAALFGVAVAGAIAVGVFASELDSQLAAASISPQVRQAVLAEAPKLAEAAVPPDVPAALRPILERTLTDAFVAGYRAVMLTAAGLAALSALCAWLTVGRGARTATASRRARA